MTQIRSATLPNFKQMISELIALPSISSCSANWDQSNLPVIERLSNWFEQLGFSVEIMPVPGVPGKANLLATLGSGPGGLVLSGHTDTVPFDEARWQSDPFKVDERDHRFYGLGTCDMKGFFPHIIQAVQELNGAEIKQPLIVLATADEESSMSGARALVEAGRPKARAAVIGEPTGLKPIRMHKGIMMEAIRLNGLAGHSSNPALGRSALECMVDVMTELRDFRQQLQSTYQNPDFEVNVPTMNLGHIHGGDNANRICGHCELHIDLRPLPGMNIDSLHDAIQKRLQPVADRHQVSLELEQLIGSVPAFACDKHSELVQLAEGLTGHSAQAVAFATEAPWLSALGMDTIVMGPGSIDQAHQPDEFLAHDQIQPCIDIIKRLIQHYCM